MKELITCMGEALIDFLPITEGGATVGFRMHAGGSLLNTAVGVARLEWPVALATKISTDFFGRRLRAYAEAEGIDTRFLIDDDAPSTLAFVATEGGEPAFTFYGEGTADTRLTPAEAPEQLVRETSMLHVGSISLLRGTTPAAIVSIVERLKGRALLSFDPNLRPGLVRDEPAYRALLRRLLALVDIVKVSAADLAWLMPGQPVEQSAADLLAYGLRLAVVTQGGRGVLALRPTAGAPFAQHLPAFPVEIADTVGAGDSFNAGMLTGLAERGVVSALALDELPADELNEVLRFAAAVAALNCTRAGANPPSRAEVAWFLAQTA